MILNHIAKGIKNQDWFVVVIEIFIVVIGIYIGLQVDDWQKARLDRADEKVFMERLHGDIVDAFNLREVPKTKSERRWASMITGLDMVYERVDRDELTVGECEAIVASVYLPQGFVPMPSLMEISNSGRLEIVDNRDLKMALTQLTIDSENTKHLIGVGDRVFLYSKYPEIAQIHGFWNLEDNEITGSYYCDLLGMRASNGFKNDFTRNVDYFDTVLNRGVKREEEQMQAVHDILDDILGLSHEGE